MIQILRDAQVPFLAVIMLVACAAKLIARAPSTRWSFALTVAAAEGVLGTGLLITRLGIVRLAAVAFFVTATSVVLERVRRGTEEGCGCFGTLSDAPAGRRGVVRAALMTVCAIVAATAPMSGCAVIWAVTPPLLAVLAAEVALFLALSPELAVAVERSRRHVPCELRDVPLEETYETLRASNAWRGSRDLLTSTEPTEVWRELCHRFVVFPAEVGERAGEVVFAVPIGGRPRAVRVGLVVDRAGDLREDEEHPAQRSWGAGV